MHTKRHNGHHVIVAVSMTGAIHANSIKNKQGNESESNLVHAVGSEQ